MKITLLCSTLGERIEELKRCLNSLNRQRYTDFELVVVSQANHESVGQTMAQATFAHVHIISDTRGISAGRNAGLTHVTGDVLMLTDDDCWYDSKALKTVVEHFTCSTTPILCFRHIDPETHTTYRKYPERAVARLSYLSLLSLASIDICIDLRTCGSWVIFDEAFGVGTKHGYGEECILLTDLKKRGMQISYYPEIIAYHPTKKVPRHLSAGEAARKVPLFCRLYGYPLGLALWLLYVGKNFFRIKGRGSLV